MIKEHIEAQSAQVHQIITQINASKQDNAYYIANPEMFNQLVLEIFKNLVSVGRRFQSKKLEHLRNWMNSQLCFIPSHDIHKYSITQLAYMIFFDMHSFPKCCICGNPLDDPKKFGNIYVGFLKTCSKRCAEQCRQASFKKTCIDRYGVPHYAMDKHCYEQRCDKMEERYGVRNVYQLESVKRQAKQTKKERHGDENFVNVQKGKQTKLQRYGDEHFNNRQKAKQTFIDHYGVDNNMKSQKGLKEYQDALEKTFGKGIRNVSQIEKVKQKKVQTCRKNYGVDYPQQSSIINSKTRKTCLDIYGYEYALQSPDIKKVGHAKYFFDGIYFDSKHELAYYMWLRDNSINFEYHPSISLVYEYSGKKHVYQPDFIVDGKLVEVKGDHFFKEDGTMICPYNRKIDGLMHAKQQCMENSKVKVLKTSQCKPYLDYVIQTYGKSFISQHKCSHKYKTNIRGK